jgi:hypothetical protein
MLGGRLVPGFIFPSVAAAADGCRAGAPGEDGLDAMTWRRQEA